MIWVYITFFCSFISHREGDCFGAMVVAWAVQRVNAGLSLVNSHFVHEAKG